MANVKQSETRRRTRPAFMLFTALLLLSGSLAAAELIQHTHSGQTAKDPVCGMSVDIDHAKFTSSYGGKTIYFCSEACKRAFDKDPAKFATAAAEEPLEALKAKYEANPNDVKLALQYGDRLIKSGEIPEAKALLERLDKIVTAKPDKADVVFQLGYVAMKEAKFPEAIAFWKIILEKYPDTERFSHATVNTAALRYQSEDDLEPAYAMMSKALADKVILDKHLPTAYKLMFMMTYDKRDYVAAKAYLEKMPEDMRQDGHIIDSIWVVYLNSGEPAKGEKMLSDYYATIKDDFFALYRLASIALEAKVKIPEAIGWIERSNELSKGEKFYVLDTYAKLLWETGKKKQAADFLEKAVSVCKNQEALPELKERLVTYKKGG